MRDPRGKENTKAPGRALSFPVRVLSDQLFGLKAVDLHLMPDDPAGSDDGLHSYGLDTRDGFRQPMVDGHLILFVLGFQSRQQHLTFNAWS